MSLIQTVGVEAREPVGTVAANEPRLLRTAPVASPPPAPIRLPEAAEPVAPQEDSLVSFGVLAAALILAPAVAVFSARTDFGSPWLWLLRVGLAAVVVVGLVLAARLEPQGPTPPQAKAPRKPVREIVKLPQPAEPATHIIRPASHCRICDRRLTEQTDRELGVDNSCYVQHGARRSYEENPAYAEWVTRSREVRAQQRTMQAEADERHVQAMAEWEAADHSGSAHRLAWSAWTRARREHEAYLASAQGRARVLATLRWRTASASALGLLVLAFF